MNKEQVEKILKELQRNFPPASQCRCARTGVLFTVARWEIVRDWFGHWTIIGRRQRMDRPGHFYGLYRQATSLRPQITRMDAMIRRVVQGGARSAAALRARHRRTNS